MTVLATTRGSRRTHSRRRDSSTRSDRQLDCWRDHGVVTDSTKAVLPGATVTLSGPAVMGTRSTVTDANGAFRFSSLAPGDYQLLFELSGFGTGDAFGHQRVARVHGDGEHRNDAWRHRGNRHGQRRSLRSSTCQSTNVATHFDAEMLATLPGARDYWAVLAQTPAVAMGRVDVGGSGALTQQPYTAYGLASAGGVNRAEVEGIMVNEGAGGGGSDMYYTDYGCVRGDRGQRRRQRRRDAEPRAC